MSLEKTNSSEMTINELLRQFLMGTERKRRSFIPAIEGRAEDLSSLGPEVLSGFDPDGDDWAAGWILQVLQRHSLKSLTKIVPPESDGWFNTPSEVSIDYSPLQNYLLSENFEEADRFTSSKLRELAGLSAVKRGYVYFTEVESIPGIDLVTIDRLWHAYSQGRFGFTIQGRLLDSLGGRYERLWPRIGWKIDGVWTRYPKAFNWSLEAPEGHMPLINQLRGVRLMDAVLNHSSLISRRKIKT